MVRETPSPYGSIVSNARAQCRKADVHLDHDSDGYPPARWEHLWAIPRDPGEFEINNIPFFVKGVSCGDLVAARHTGEEWEFEKVLKPGGHSTVRVLLFDTFGEAHAKVREDLARLGCDTEGSRVLPARQVARPQTHLRPAGVSFEDRQDVLGHKSSRITTHSSQSELVNLIAAAEKVGQTDAHKMPTMTFLRRRSG